MKTYIIWNAEKVRNCCTQTQHAGLSGDKYEDLKKAEKWTKSSVSSEVRTDNILQLIEAIHCETDVCPCFVEKKIKLELELTPTELDAIILTCESPVIELADETMEYLKSVRGAEK